MEWTQEELSASAKLVLSTVLAGAGWVSSHVVAQSLDPFSAAFLRFLFASIFLFVLSCRAEQRLPAFPRQHWLGLAVLGFSSVFLSTVLFNLGLAHTPASRATLIVACLPSLVAICAALFLGKRTTAIGVCGIALSLLGVGVILTGGNTALFFANGMELGDIFILCGVLAWVVYSLTGAHVMKQTTPLTAVTWSCILGTLMLLPAALANGLIHQIMGTPLNIWTHLLFLGIGCGGLAYAWYFEGIRKLGAPRASIFMNLVPVFGTLFAVVLLGESLNIALAAGGGLVLSGVVITNRLG